MKKMKIHIVGFLFAAALLQTGCKEEFLDLKPIAKETDETFYTNFENVDMTVTAAYSRLKFLMYDVNTILANQAACDDVEVGGENANDGADWKLMDQLIHNPGNVQLENIWAINYKGIRLANSALFYLPRFLEEQPEMAKQRIAESKFLRAFYHFQLLQAYGGIPIVDKILSPAEFYLPRNSVSEVLQFIEADLEEAVPDLKNRSELGISEVGRASKGAAQSLLAKAYLFESSYAKYHNGDERFAGCEQKFDKALQHAEAVIGSNEYKLVGIDGERFESWWGERYSAGGANTIGAFRWIFSKDGDNSQESVFEAQNAVDGRGWSHSTGNGITIFTTCRYTSLNPTTMYGWGFNLPSEYLIGAFRNADTRETGLAAENTEVIDQRADPRFITTVGLEGDLMLTRKGLTATGDLVWDKMSLANVPTNSACRKYECHPDESILNPDKQANESGPINWKLIRYADVVLMAAEAALENGNSSRALELVNMVRTRARKSNNNPDQSTWVYPKNLSSITMADIIHERRIELALETSRFFDLVRWNKCDQFINGSELALTPGRKLEFDPEKHFFLPIPQTQIQLSEGNLKQYPGWN